MAVEIADAVAGVAAVVVAVVDAGAVVVPVVVEGAADGTAGTAAVVGTKDLLPRICTDIHGYTNGRSIRSDPCKSVARLIAELGGL
jgi:hypothetical protein